MKKVIGTIIFPIFCLLLSFFVLLTDRQFTYSLLDNPESIQPTKQLLQYFEGRAQVPEIFTTEEKSHLADVKQLIQFSFIALIITAILLFYTFTKKTVKYGTYLLLAILALSSIIPFDLLFTKFHQIFFQQGNWQFAPDSTLITFYSSSFFANYALAIAIHAIIIASMLTYLQVVSRRG